MTWDRVFFAGEFRRTLDDRYRLSIPPELADLLQDEEVILAKERPGALSVWPQPLWQQRTESGLELVRQKFASGRLDNRLVQLQHVGRLLSTRHTEISLAGRGRLTIPESFRPFLDVEPGGEVMVVGAAVCIEIWQPAAWIEYLRAEIASFAQRLEDLAE